MYDLIVNKILEIITTNFNVSIKKENTKILFPDIGIDSIQFVNLIIILEQDYEMEFEDDFLIPQYNSISTLSKHIYDKICSRK